MPNSNHIQVRIQGLNQRTHDKFDITCDEGLAKLIYILNTKGVGTCYSCQGDSDSGIGTGAYIVIKVTGSRYLALAHDIIHAYFYKYFIHTETDRFGRITFYMYDSKQSLYALAGLQEDYINDPCTWANGVKIRFEINNCDITNILSEPTTEKGTKNK